MLLYESLSLGFELCSDENMVADPDAANSQQQLYKTVRRYYAGHIGGHDIVPHVADD